MSVASAHNGQREDASTSARRALELFERTDDGPGRAAAVMQMGYLAAEAGRLREARDLLERALALWKAFAPNTGWLPPILIALADLDDTLGKPERVPGRLRQAIEILVHIGDRAGVAHCEELLEANAAQTPE
jgi:tetratricopeptide (TPR) repeat protein